MREVNSRDRELSELGLYVSGPGVWMLRGTRGQVCGAMQLDSVGGNERDVVSRALSCDTEREQGKTSERERDECSKRSCGLRWLTAMGPEG